jgi:hypothetical protein
MLNRFWALGLFVGAFGVTLFIVLWQRHPSEAVTSAAPVITHPRTGLIETPSEPMNTPLAEVQQPHDSRPAAIAPTARAAPAVIAEADANGPPQPLPLAINPVPYRGHPGLHWVDIRNASRDPLGISVRLSNDTTGKSLQQELTLSSGVATVLGKDDGWEIETGDTLTVSNPNFVDRIVTIS